MHPPPQPLNHQSMYPSINLLHPSPNHLSTPINIPGHCASRLQVNFVERSFSTFRNVKDVLRGDATKTFFPLGEKQQLQMLLTCSRIWINSGYLAADLRVASHSFIVLPTDINAICPLEEKEQLWIG
jgi:hypothetical protein